MKKTIAILIAATLLVCLFTGCAGGEKKKVYVFAAASMTETLTEIGKTYMEDHKEIELVFTFESSGTLKTMIEEGSDCDLFISAGQKQMNQLDVTTDSEVNPTGLDFVKTDSRCNLLENKVALCVPEGNPKNVNSYEELKAALEAGDVLMAMGNSDVPVGQYTQKILTYFGLNEQTLASEGLITYGGNVKEVTSQISEAAVDCGIIYQTDAFSAKLTVVDTATKDMCGQVIYPAAVLKTAKNAGDAQAFLDYLKTPEASAVFEKVGFTPLS